MEILSVAQLNRYVAFRLQEDSNLRIVFVRGEIANFKRNFKSGHCYFTVQDADASVRAVMFRSNAALLKFDPENGMDVVLQGKVTLYEKGGDYQLMVTDIVPAGIGAQAAALAQRREKLAKLGFFDPARKRPLPQMPKKIGIVTSANGAALQDMLQILARRYPLGNVCIYPALVQGDAAPASIAAALASAGSDGCDVILMGRGGGSKEDLSAFQSETVAEAVFRSPVPVVSAVGHETDHCIADEVADLRAPTPSAAAELAVPTREALYARLEAMRTALTQAFSADLASRAKTLGNLQHKLTMQSPMQRVALQAQTHSALTARLHGAMAHLMQRKTQQWDMVTGRLEAVSPVAILRRGYALVYHEETLVRDAKSLNTGDVLRIRLGDGSVTAEVTGIEGDEA